jgi:serine protease Do
MKHLEKSWLRGSMWLLMLATPAAWLNAEEKLDAAGAAHTERVQPGAVRELAGMSGDMERLSAQVAPKVVQIATQGLKVAGTGEEQPAGVLVAEHGSGSGFLVSSDGYLFTNAHVIANATRIKVMLQPVNSGAQPGAMIEYAGTLVGVDADNDLALLKIEVQGVPFFDLGREATPRQGQFALAYGSPMGLSQSATLGLVSAVDRQLNPDDPRAYIQTDASMNPGNSGGPLVDLEGKLLGVNTMILTQSGGSEGIGFAVPLDVIQHAYAGLRQKGMVARPLLGIQPRSLTADLIAGLGLKVHQGVLLEDVAPYGAGAAAGLLPGDVLLSLNTEPIHNLRDLYRTESALSAGTPVELVVMRRENLRLLRITPDAPRETAPVLSPGSVSEKENLVFRLGLYGVTLTPAVASSLGGIRDEHRDEHRDGLRDGRGVLVLALAGSGLAGQNAVEPGDVVHEVNGGVVDGVASLRMALETIPDGAPLVLQIERGGMRSYLTLGGMAGSEHLPRKASGARGTHGTQPPEGSLRY